jgi:hypothetical protein
MTRINLPYVQRITDRRGRVRHYFRRPGYERATLPGVPGSAPFMAAYERALGDRRSVGGERTKPGSVSALLIAFYASAEWSTLADVTRSNYRHIYERWRALDGDLPVAMIQPRHVRAMLDRMKATPGAARNFRKRLASLMDFAVSRDWRRDNPVRVVKAPKSPSGVSARGRKKISPYSRNTTARAPGRGEPYICCSIPASADRTFRVWARSTSGQAKSTSRNLRGATQRTAQSGSPSRFTRSWRQSLPLRRPTA